MYWTCKCGTKNPENSLACGNCGAKADIKRKIAIAWVFGGATAFFLAYFIGTFIGGTMVAFSLEPTDDEVMATVKSKGIKAKTLLELDPTESNKAREETIAKKKNSMSGLVRAVLMWVFPLLIFPVFGAAVGFISEGRTVIEAALGSLLGQLIGFVVARFMYGFEIYWMELIIGMVLGFVAAGVGAYVGEAIQEKREREVLDADDLDAARLESDG